MDQPKKMKPTFILPWLAAGIISGLPPVHAADTFVYFGTHRAQGRTSVFRSRILTRTPAR
jgi:hypothetical protein